MVIKQVSLLLLVACLAAQSNAGPIAKAKAEAEAKSYASGYGYNYNPLAFGADPQPSRYHAQDELGQYSYGYSDGQSTKQEIKTADGVVRGSYSYLDPNGRVQRVTYVSDALGFRTDNAPLAKPVVPAVIAPTVAYSHLPYATKYKYLLPSGAIPSIHPTLAAGTPTVKGPIQPNIVPSAPFATHTKYHAQDELGQYHFGYREPNSARTEIRLANGAVKGSYNYVDDKGQIQTVQYVSDRLGFRAAGTTIPVADHKLPVHVSHTPEVISARDQHNRLFAEIKAQNQKLAQDRAILVEQVEEHPVVPVQNPHPLPHNVAGNFPLTPEAVVEPVAIPQPYQYDYPSQPAPVVVEQVAQPIVPDELPVAAVVPLVAAAVPAVPDSSQFHAQDELGQYSYGYSNANSAKTETKTADGVVRGGYTYIDANGVQQTVNYMSDALGFRVAATNLPVHVIPDDGHAEEAHSPVEPEPATIVTPQVSYSHLPYATNYGYLLAPVPYASVPAPTPIQHGVDNAPNTQYHAQDELGQYSYGYSGDTSAKQEVKTADGVVKGSYSYVDANGKLQSVQYISDALGFRAVGTNFPTAPQNQDSMIKPHVAYSYLPYATNHPYYVSY